MRKDFSVRDFANATKLDMGSATGTVKFLTNQGVVERVGKRPSMRKDGGPGGKPSYLYRVCEAGMDAWEALGFEDDIGSEPPVFLIPTPAEPRTAAPAEPELAAPSDVLDASGGSEDMAYDDTNEEPLASDDAPEEDFRDFDDSETTNPGISDAA